MAYPTLLWFAGYSNVSSVVIVIIGFIVMSIFILLVSMNSDLSGTPQPLPGVEQRNMVKVVNPFFLQLEKEGKSLKDGISFHLSRLCPCKAVVLWGVSINNFHNFILEKGHEVRKKLLSQDISDTLHLDSLHRESFQFSNAGDDVLSIPCPATVSSSTLGNIPRQRYPVAVFVFVPESPEMSCPDEEGDSECSNNIVGLISVIHLKDEYVTQSSHVIQQYIKTAGVPIYSLKPLFVNIPSASPDFERDCHERGDVSMNDNRQSNLDAPVSSYEDDNQRQSMAGSDVTSPSTGCKEQLRSRASGSFPMSGNSSRSIRSEVSSLAAPHADSEQYDSAQVEHSQASVRRRRQIFPQHANQNFSPAAGLQNVWRDEQDNLGYKHGSSEEELSSEESSSAECVVCQTKKVMCVLLPCRHACVCYHCLKLLDRCPLCRGAIESYFLLFGSTGDETGSGYENNYEDDGIIHNLEQHAVNASFAEKWERLCMRLNALLGFR
ncbi:cell growth regulator with RING finger domain protein 1-like [Elysia marginata]|uniref:Cell growth regulator with RING finger domain protein 1-like n=1 Tax=Elysia marginata TaxID=1093978 RepID=A0AAV4JYV4_9GAST|nr:cell growth regulator with RING finger domain protein 1-like [Elysia marginata]